LAARDWLVVVDEIVGIMGSGRSLSEVMECAPDDVLNIFGWERNTAGRIVSFADGRCVGSAEFEHAAIGLLRMMYIGNNGSSVYMHPAIAVLTPFWRKQLVSVRSLASAEQNAVRKLSAKREASRQLVRSVMLNESYAWHIDNSQLSTWNMGEDCDPRLFIKFAVKGRRK
jgi:hypothetical protein